MSDYIDLSNYDPDDIPEGKIHEAGAEVQATISRMTKDVDKNGTPYIMPWFEDREDPNVEDWNDYLPLPDKEDTEKDKGKKLRKLNAFDKAFELGIFNGEFKVEDAKGASGWVILGVGSDAEGNPSNSVKKYVTQG